jgi:glycosyltransferase involved in cell wall biosynthesis
MKRSVCLDARMWRASGIGTYLRGLLPALESAGWGTWHFSALVGETFRLGESTASVRRVSAPIYSLREQWEIPAAFRGSRAGLLHVPHYNVPLTLAGRSVVTVHDLIHLKFPEFLSSRLARAYAHFYFRTVVPRARAILTVSEHTRRDLIQELGIPADRITVAPPAVPAGFRPIDLAQAREQTASLRLPERFFLYVGNLKEFKNVPFLLRAYREWTAARGGPPLVVVGRNFIPGLEAQLQGDPHVRWLQSVENEALPAIYAQSLALVFPSLYEGFGLPPLEAMACGTPVICSNRASLPEVVGDAAILFDPTDVAALRDAFDVVASNETKRTGMREAGLRQSGKFSWQKTAEATLKVYEGCLS